MLVSDFGNSINIGDVAVRVAERFKVNRLGIILDCALKLIKVVSVNKGCRYTELRKRMCEQIVAAAVDCFLCNDVIACLR